MAKAPKVPDNDQNGLPLEAALRRWADPQALQEFANLEARLKEADAGAAKPLDEQRRALREVLECEFRARLYRRELTSTGIPYPPGHRPTREPLSHELWFSDPDDYNFAGGPEFEESRFYASDGRLLFDRVLVSLPSESSSQPEQTLNRLPFPLWFYIDENARRVLFSVGVELTGTSFDVIDALTSAFDEEKARSTDPDDHRYVKMKQLEIALGKDETAVRKNIARLRAAFAAQCRSKLAIITGPNEVVQSTQWSGYRLNPHLTRVYFGDPAASQTSRPES
jgi:hypothetical protein